MSQKHFTKKGLTLIETLLYIALFSALILVGMPLLIELNTWHSKEALLAGSTANFFFIDGKIRSLTQNVNRIIEPAPSQSSNSLIFETPHDGRFILQRDPSFNGSLVLVKESDNSQELLSGTSTNIQYVNFYRPSGGSFESFSFNAEINGFSFGTTTYVFKNP